MAAQTVREHERKFAVDTDFVMPDLALAGLPVVERGRPVTLTATYFDTADLRLARSKVTLRRRTGGKDAGWHLKLQVDPGTPDVRDEIQLPSTSARVPPPELLELVLGLTRGADVTALATMRTRRTPTVLSSRDGRLAVEVVDDVVTVTEGPMAGLAYRELEVEALTPEAGLDVVASLLLETGAREGEFASKGARALGAPAELSPIVPAATAATPADPAALVVRNHLRTHVAAIIHQDTRVRRDLPDSVHQFRVAARRLRAGLQSFAPLVDDEWGLHLRGELGWIAGVLGLARDTEVLEDHLIAAVRALPAELDRAAGLVLIQDDLEANLVDATKSAHEAMGSARYLELLDNLVAATEVPRTTALADGPAGEVLPPLVKRRFKKLARMADVLPNELDGHDDDWHATRIAGKKARYVAEAVVPVFGAPARKYVKQMERVTELLGEHQDCAIAAETVRGLINRGTGPNAAFTLGALYDQQRQRVQGVRHEFVDAWPQIRHKRWRRWLDTDAPGEL
ncbi:MAG: CYTH and CHAD domain-containing protein [Actinomycetes bacterium]